MATSPYKRSYKSIPTGLRTWIPKNGWGYTDFTFHENTLAIRRIALMEAFQSQEDYIRYEELIEMKTTLESILVDPYHHYPEFDKDKCLEIMQNAINDGTATIHSDRKYGIFPNLK